MRNIVFFLFMMIFITPAHSQDLKGVPPREIFIRGEVTEQMAFEVDREMRALNSSGSEEITIHITSPGGGVYSGLQIYDTIAESAAPTRVICEGYCMSMAAVLLESGTIREATENATIMFHGIATIAQGKLPEIMKEVAEAQRLDDMMNEHIAKRSGLSISAVEKMKSYDHFMSAKEAKILNLIDVVRGSGR